MQSILTCEGKHLSYKQPAPRGEQQVRLWKKEVSGIVGGRLWKKKKTFEKISMWYHVFTPLGNVQYKQHTKSNCIWTFHDPQSPARISEHPAIAQKGHQLIDSSLNFSCFPHEGNYNDYNDCKEIVFACSDNFRQYWNTRPTIMLCHMKAGTLFNTVITGLK